MRKTTFTLMVLLFIMTACQDYESEIMFQNDTQTTYDANSINADEAIEIARQFLGNTRNIEMPEPKAIVSTIGNIQNADTLGWILNLGENDGFIITAGDKRMEPILAYADTGIFTYSKDASNPIFSIFVQNLAAYKESVEEESDEEGIQIVYPSLNSVYPMLRKGYWKQSEPFNFFVNQHHPGFPVGCVPLATSQIMMNCKDTIVYHNRIFDCNKILNAMADSLNGTIVVPPITIYPTNTNALSLSSPTRPTLPMTYSEAVMEIARFLDYMGQDMPVTFEIEEDGSKLTTAPINSAVRMFHEMGFQCPNTTLKPYDAGAMVEFLVSKHLLYMYTGLNRIVDWQGNEITDITVGHTFIIDGCNVKYDTQFVSARPKIYFHLDWGAGGGGNGYYFDNVFHVTRGIVEYDAPTNSMRYFPVKIEN